jgi:hypothetical protein
LPSTATATATGNITPETPLIAAGILGCSESTARRHVLAGLLPTTDRYRHGALSRGDVE